MVTPTLLIIKEYMLNRPLRVLKLTLLSTVLLFDISINESWQGTHMIFGLHVWSAFSPVVGACGGRK